MGDISANPDERKRRIFARIMQDMEAWYPQCRPILIPEGRAEISKWPALAQHCDNWMEDATRIAVSGYKQVLEDGPEVCDSESDSDNSDHGEMWSYADMCTPDMLGPDGKPKNGGPQQLSAAQVLALRAAAQRTSGSTEPTTQASSRPVAPGNPDGEPLVPPKDQKKRKARAKEQLGAQGKRIRVGQSVALLIPPPVRRFVKGSTTDRPSLRGARHPS
jgi:hypothetical protein